MILNNQDKAEAYLTCLDLAIRADRSPTPTPAEITAAADAFFAALQAQ